MKKKALKKSIQAQCTGFHSDFDGAKISQLTGEIEHTEE